MFKLNRKLEERAQKFRRKFQEMLASHGIDVHKTDDSSGPENERQDLARHRDKRTRLGRGNSRRYDN